MPDRRIEISTSHEVGMALLGPIFYEYCYRLHHYLEAMRNGDVVALYMARGGFRLHYLYELFCRQNGFTAPVSERLFFTSRFAAARGCLLGDAEYVIPLITREFLGLPVSAMLEALLPGEQILDERLFFTRSSTSELSALLGRNDQLGRKLKKSLLEQAMLMRQYLGELTGGQRRLLLIDTGWTGHTQSMLMRAFPDREWLGLYLGKWDYLHQHPSHFTNVIGVSVEGTGYDPRHAETALFCYHHLIEGVLEVPFPSTSGYVSDPETGRVVADSQLSGQPVITAPLKDEPLFQGIVDYFAETPPRLSGLLIHREGRFAYQALRRLILFPRLTNYQALIVAQRSADFGKHDYVPVIVPKQATDGIFQRFRRLRGSLWIQGQAVSDWGRLAPALLFVIHFSLVLSFVLERGNNFWKRICK